MNSKAELVRAKHPNIVTRAKSLALLGMNAESIANKCSLGYATVQDILQDVVSREEVAKLPDAVKERLANLKDSSGNSVAEVSYMDVIGEYSAARDTIKNNTAHNLHTSVGVILKSALRTLTSDYNLSRPEHALRALTVLPNLLSMANSLEDRATTVTQPKYIIDDITGDVVKNPEHKDSSNNSAGHSVILLSPESALTVLRSTTNTSVKLDKNGNVIGVQAGDIMEDLTPLNISEIDNMVQ